jgi:hypothetical protein
MAEQNTTIPIMSPERLTLNSSVIETMLPQGDIEIYDDAVEQTNSGEKFDVPVHTEFMSQCIKELTFNKKTVNVVKLSVGYALITGGQNYCVIGETIHPLHRWKSSWRPLPLI